MALQTTKKTLMEKWVWTGIYKWFYISVQWMSENQRIFNLTSNPGTAEALTHLQLKHERLANNADNLEQLEFLYTPGKHAGLYHFHRSDGHTPGEGHRKASIFLQDPHRSYFLILSFLCNIVLLKTGPSDKLFVNWREATAHPFEDWVGDTLLAPCWCPQLGSYCRQSSTNASHGHAKPLLLKIRNQLSSWETSKSSS